MSNDPSHDSAPLERIVAEFIAGDELLDVIGCLSAAEYAQYEVALLRVLRERPEMFGDAWDMLEAKLYERADAQLRRDMDSADRARVDLAA